VDTTALYALAARLDGHAEVIRSRARTLAARRDALRWHSPAARRCRTRLDAIVGGLIACAGQADAVAGLVRAHAGRLP
jgi:hypothetical protein